jgi:hypothetical protein
VPLSGNALEDLMHMDFGATGERIVDVLPVQEKYLHTEAPRFFPMTPIEMPV